MTSNRGSGRSTGALMAQRTKVCSRCNKERDVTMFYDGYGKETRTCIKCRITRNQKRGYDFTGERERKIPEKTKTCKRCGQTKPLASFLPGFDHCRECQRKRRTDASIGDDQRRQGREAG